MVYILKTLKKINIDFFKTEILQMLVRSQVSGGGSGWNQCIGKA